MVAHATKFYPNLSDYNPFLGETVIMAGFDVPGDAVNEPESDQGPDADNRCNE